MQPQIQWGDAASMPALHWRGPQSRIPVSRQPYRRQRQGCARKSVAAHAPGLNFFAKLPKPDKQSGVMPGIVHTSTRSKNWALVYHLLDGRFSAPSPVYVG
jgi:hypothetical protein